MKRNPFIDVLRGLSILAVMGMHIWLTSPAGAAAPERLRLVLTSGYYGVTVFFVISGYLIASTSLKRFGSLPEIDPLQYAALRVGRIVPLLLVVLALLITLALQHAVGFTFPKGASVLEPTAGVLSLRFNDWYLHHRNDPHAQAWCVMWSLSIEQIFYVLFPVASRTVRSRALMVSFLLLSLPFALYQRASTGWDALFEFGGCVDALAIGVLTALLVDRARDRARPVLAVVGMLGALGALYWIAHLKPPKENIQWGPTVCALAAGVFIFSSTRFPSTFAARRSLRVAAAVLGLPLLLLGGLGQASYEAYLLHLPLQRLVTNYLWPKASENAAALIILIGVGSFLLNRAFTEPANRLVRDVLLGRGRRTETRRAVRSFAPIGAALAVLAIPLIVVARDTRHPTAVVSASARIRPADLGGSNIPLVVYGVSGDADLVSVVKRDDGKIQVQYDHWGLAPVIKVLRPELVKEDFTVTLDCRTPAVRVGGELILGRDELVGFTPHEEIAIGRNDIGAGTMVAAAGAELAAGTLTFDNGTTSETRAWKRGD